MSYLEIKRKTIAEKELVLLPKEEAVKALKAQRFCPCEGKITREREICRDVLQEDGATRAYLSTAVVDEYDPDEADRNFYLKLLDEGFELYKDRESKLTIMLPDRILEGWDYEPIVQALYTT
ncbi:MAG: hypothetical protein V1887_03895 [Candidatus Aenigmatarchaeota archaeon]